MNNVKLKLFLLLLIPILILGISNFFVQASDIDDLIMQLQNGSPSKRETASNDLASYGSDAVEPLLHYLKEGDDQLRADVSYTLANMYQRDLEPVVTELISYLSDPFWKVRANIALTLRKIGPRANIAAESLVELLDDEEARVRSAAAYALEKIKPSPEIVLTPLCKSLSDPDRDTRWAALNAIKELESSAAKAVDSVIPCLTDKSMWVRKEAASTLGSIGNDSDKVISALSSALEEEIRTRNKMREEDSSNYQYFEVDLPQEMIQALGDLGEKSIPALQKILVSGKYYNSSARELHNIGEPAIPALAEAVTSCSDSEARNIAAYYLAQIGHPAISELDLLSKHSDSGVRKAVASSFDSNMGSDPEVLSLLMRLLQDNNNFVRLEAAKTFENLRVNMDTFSLYIEGLTLMSGDEMPAVRVLAARGFKDNIAHASQAIPVVEKLARDVDVEVRKTALETIISMIYYENLTDEDMSGPIQVLIEGTIDQSNEVRKVAIEALGYAAFFGRKISNLDLVIERIKDAIDIEELQVTAITALGNFGINAKNALPDLLSVFWNSNYDVQRMPEKIIATCGSLAQIGGKEIIPEMLKALKSKKACIRLNGVMVLANLGKEAKEAVPYLEKVKASDPSFMVKIHAESALQQIK